MCGIFGMYGSKDAASLTYLGLYALQHRGEESAGIISYDKNRIMQHQGMGLVRDFIGVDSLKYISLEGMLKAMPLPKNEFCTACFNLKYPTAIPKGFKKIAFGEL